MALRLKDRGQPGELDADTRRARILGRSLTTTSGQTPGVVLLHGFTGSTWDVLPLGESLAEAGFPVEIPVMRGHDGGIEGVRASTLAQWREDVDKAIDIQRKATGQPVVMAGLSMGALMSLDAAIRRPDDVAGVVSMAAPLNLGGPARGLGLLASRVPFARKLVWPKLGGSDISTKEPLPGPGGIPALALHQLVGLTDAVRGRLAEIRCPLLVLHAEQDHTAPLASAFTLANGSGAERVRLVILSDGFHILTRDVCQDTVATEVRGFVSDLQGAASRLLPRAKP
ncbi:MAG: carboxylesterase [Myxococcota bacterium]